jgi:predicted esterase
MVGENSYKVIQVVIRMQIIIEDGKVKHIPVLDVYHPDISENHPLIIMLHGLSSSKETGLANAYRFAKQGFHIVLFDAFRHGELADGQFQKLDYFQKTLETTTIIRETVKYIEILIEHYQTVDNIDSNRIGLIGFSLGGVIVYKYISEDKNPAVKAAVPVVASPMGGTLRQLIKKSSEPDRYLDEAKITDAEREAPIHRLKELTDFPLLMLNGVEDDHFSIEDVRACYNQLIKNYTDQQKIKKIEYQNVGHQVTQEMIDEAILWFQKYL